ncbi:alkaline phosphatase family protein [Gemmatimonas sp.]|uniref:alkaline phosphatase family protein n=1 Tax=Gemmatimonas sp. TaxID=1962908 RepID=UPI00286E7363|nr:alkaline phosphatase family protein [Gemmatimonas sp.]
MHSATRLIKTSVFHLLLFPLALACVPWRRAPPLEPPVANRLVLALDGVDYRDIVDARARGLFAGFREPSRLISTFPSISDVSWHDIMGVQPPPGYQRIFYSARQNAVVGELFDAIKPIEYERRMDFAFGTKLHHLGAYLMSNQVARNEVDADVKEFLKRGGRPTVYAYNVGPDALQHTRGALDKYLAHLDRKLAELQRTYRTRTGRDLEILILSDHGHNRASSAGFLPVVEALEQQGFHTFRSLRDPTDVAFSVDGVTTGFGVFAHPDSVARVASLLAALDGVAVVSWRESDTRYFVRSDSALAEVTTRGRGDSAVFRYHALRGDPLHYASVLARMQHDRDVSPDGFASTATWLRYTSGELFPVAPPRIVRGHTAITLNPAPILVSLDDKMRVGLGAVSVANRMRPLGGTHGALSATNSLGVIMTNFVDTHDDVTSSVRHQFGGFDDLHDPATHASSLRLSTTSMLRADRWSSFHGDETPAALSALPDTEPLFVLSLSDADRRWAGAAARVLVDLRRQDRGANGGTAVSNSYWALAQWTASRDGRAFAMSASRLKLAPLEPSSAFVVRVVIDRVPDPGVETRGAASKMVASLIVRTDARGAVAIY